MRYTAPSHRRRLFSVTLETQQAEAMHRLTALRAELAALEAEPEIQVRLAKASDKSSDPQTPAEKVRLFRSLFRGREDIYPTRFVSKKTGKSGYAPACRTSSSGASASCRR